MDIVLRGVTKVYRGNIRALDGVDLEIGMGLTGLLGPNGAGKTTLMRILAGIVRPTAGALRIGGVDARTEGGRTAVKRTLGYVPQELGLYPDLSARETLDYIAILKGLGDAPARRRRVADLLDVVGLSDVAARKVKTFSGGMKRRVGIAQALLNDPRLLIVDEPTAGLDPEERIRFRNLLVDLGGDRVVLLSTHIVEDIAQTCRRVAVLTGGRIIFDGTTAALAQAAAGYVWTVTTEGPKPAGQVTVLAMAPHGAVTRYRVLGTPDDHGQDVPAAPAVPTLEDGYLWLMNKRQMPLAAASGGG